MLKLLLLRAWLTSSQELFYQCTRPSLAYFLFVFVTMHVPVLSSLSLQYSFFFPMLSQHAHTLVHTCTYITHTQVGLVNLLWRHYSWPAMAEARKVLGGAGPAIAAVPASILWAGISMVELFRDVATKRTSPSQLLPRTGFYGFTATGQVCVCVCVWISYLELGCMGAVSMFLSSVSCYHAQAFMASWPQARCVFECCHFWVRAMFVSFGPASCYDAQAFAAPRPGVCKTG